MAFLGIGKKDPTILGNEYAAGKFYNPETTFLGGTYEDLYNSTGVLYGKSTGEEIAKVNVDQSKIDLTAEQQTAINNNKNLKETQDRLKKQGAGAQQTVLGGRGY